jgi:hypothetical protein
MSVQAALRTQQLLICAAAAKPWPAQLQARSYTRGASGKCRSILHVLVCRYHVVKLSQ